MVLDLARASLCLRVVCYGLKLVRVNPLISPDTNTDPHGFNYLNDHRVGSLRDE
jgi:hypothetical protein